MAFLKEIYRFVLGDSDEVYTVTSGQFSENYLGETYLPVPIERSDFISSDNADTDQLTIRLSIENEVAKKWFSDSTDRQIEVTVFQIVSGQANAFFVGRLTAINPNSKDFEFVFQSLLQSLNRNGLQDAMTIGCRFSLYSSRCGVVRTNFETTSNVTNLIDRIVTCPSAANESDGFFNGGIFEDASGSLRMIANHVGDQITLTRELPSLVREIEQNGLLSINVKLFPGCDKTSETCVNRFDNLLNFGGFEYLPTDNPFEGSLV